MRRRAETSHLRGRLTNGQKANFLTVQDVHLDRFGLTAGRATLVPAVIRIGSSLNQQIAGRRLALFRDDVHPAPRRFVADHLRREKTSSFSGIAYLHVILP